jgi:plasmid maintenance system antidote protein VapI
VTRIQGTISERHAVSGDTALSLGRYFGTAPDVRLNMQRGFGLERAAEPVGLRRR